jgi:iron(III) transport system substrate-binding protein
LSPPRIIALAAAAASAALVAALLGAVAPVKASGKQTAVTLTIYSGRDEALVKPLFDRFTRRTGIELRVRYGDTAELAATLLEEGGNSPADVFFAQDGGALSVVAAKGRLRVLPARTLSRVPKRFRAPGKRWVGTSGRVRVVAYNTSAWSRRTLPKTIWGFTSRRFRGKIGLPPTNASFQAFVTAMRVRAGLRRTRDWLRRIKANGARFYARNSQVLSAVANREIEIGFVNHYYLYQLKEQQPGARVANLFLGQRDPGALVNVAGAGVLASSDAPNTSVRFLNFLLSKEAQRFFATGPGRAEYPLVRGLKPRDGLPPLGRLEGARIGFWRLGRELPRTLQLLSELGYTR